MKTFPNLVTIEGRPLDFDDKEKDSLQPSCVDLRAGRIYIHGQEFSSPEDKVELPPGALVHIESMERITTPKHIMGFLVPKNSKSQAGLLLLNAGHVDPGWENGFITAEVMNVTAAKFTIAVGEPLFSIVFLHLQSSATKSPRLEPDDIRRFGARQAMEARPRTGYESYVQDLRTDMEDRLQQLRTDIRKEYATKEEAHVEVWNRRTLFIGLMVLLLTTLAAMLGAVAIAVQIAN